MCQAGRQAHVRQAGRLGGPGGLAGGPGAGLVSGQAGQGGGGGGMGLRVETIYVESSEGNWHDSFIPR